jgi:hypothetical protein
MELVHYFFHPNFRLVITKYSEFLVDVYGDMPYQQSEAV